MAYTYEEVKSIVLPLLKPEMTVEDIAALIKSRFPDIDFQGMMHFANLLKGEMPIAQPPYLLIGGIVAGLAIGFLIGKVT